MLSLLQNVEAISSCRDRDQLGQHMLRAAESILGQKANVALFRREPHGAVDLQYFSGASARDSLMEAWSGLLDRTRQSGQHSTLRECNRIYGSFLLPPSEISVDQVLLTYAVDASETSHSEEKIAFLARIYGNQISMLDYGELDTLTRLFNRKTFDEAFDRLLATRISESAEDSLRSDRRGHAEREAPAWLGVIDIDHFKRVNDSFGHLFGDEVLLRVGDLMRKTFRGGDRLFRFGGEEFVVILNAEDEAVASRGFDRFRLSVEGHEFPQVGQVTCSIGFTAVAKNDVPTDAVGRADEALYFAKKNGRNQVFCYEALLQEGAIAPPAVLESAVSDSDIDALFD